MDSIVNAFIGPTLSNFIKNYRKEQLQLSLLSGTGKMSNVELIGSSIQELLLIPPTFDIATAACDSFEIKVPFTDISRQPITITMNRVDVVVEEPEVIKPRSHNLDKKSKSSSTESATGFNAIKNVVINIAEIHFSLRTRGSFTYNPDYRPSISAHMSRISVFSCDERWQKLDNISPSPYKDAERGVMLLYKRICVGEIDLRVRMQHDDPGFSLLEKMPVEVRSITEFKSSNSAWIGSRVQLCLDTLILQLNQDRWQRLTELGFSLQAALRREVPGDVPVADVHDTSRNRLRYGVQVSTAMLDLMTGPGEEGLSLLGHDLKLMLEPARKTDYVVKDLSYRGGDEAVPCWESQVHAFCASIVFKERMHQPRKVHPLILSQALEGDAGSAASPPPFAKLAFCYRTRIETPSAELRRRVPELEFDVDVNGFRAVLDKDVWRAAYAFLIEGPLLGGLGQGAEALRRKLSTAQAVPAPVPAADAAPASSFFSRTIVFSVRLFDTQLILPPSPVSPSALLSSSSLLLRVKRLAATNQPDWPFPPFYSDALKLLPLPHHAPTPPEGTVQKYQVVFESLSLTYDRLATPNPNSNPNPNPSPASRLSALTAVVVHPFTVKAYGRFFSPAATGVPGHVRVECFVHCGAVLGKVTASQCRVALEAGREAVEWVRELVRDERERQRAAEIWRVGAKALGQGAKGEGALLGVSQVRDAKDALAFLKRAGEQEETVKRAAREGMERVAFTCYARMEEVRLELPALSAWVPSRDSGVVHLNWDSLVDPAGDPTARDHLLFQIAWERLEGVVDSAGDTQAGCARVRSASLAGIDHASLPASLQIGPVEGGGGGVGERYVACATYVRQGKERGEAKAVVQGIEVLAVLKPNAIERGMRELVPDVVHLVKLIKERVEEWRSERKKGEVEEKKQEEEVVGGKSKGERVMEAAQTEVLRATKAADEIVEGGLSSLLYSWSAELADCRMRYAERMPNGALVSRGALALGTGNKEEVVAALANAEDQLIQTRLQLAQVESEKFDMKSQMDKIKTNVRALEEALAKANLAMAEALTENDSLKSRMRSAAAPASSSSKRK